MDGRIREGGSGHQLVGCSLVGRHSRKDDTEERRDDNFFVTRHDCYLSPVVGLQLNGLQGTGKPGDGADGHHALPLMSQRLLVPPARLVYTAPSARVGDSGVRHFVEVDQT